MKHYIYYLLIAIFTSIAVHSQETLQNEPMIFEGCGIDYIVKSQKITNRDSSVIFKNLFFPGSQFPIKLDIKELPTECYKIEKAYIWMTYSNGEVDNKNPEPWTYKFSINSPDGTIDTLSATIIGENAGTQWGSDNFKWNYRLDVTDIINTNGQYSINTEGAKNNLFMWYLDGMALMIVYRKYDSDYQGHLILNDGLVTSYHDTTAANRVLSRSFNFKGLNVCEPSSDTRSFILVSDLEGTNADEGGVEDDCYILFDFNGYGSPKNRIRKFWNYETVNSFPLTQGQTDYKFTVASVPGHPRKDYFSLALMGVYYRTKNCDAVLCDKNFPTILSTTSNQICPGEEVTLTANTTEDYANENIRYHWTSIPAGLDQTGKSIKVSPSVTTTYKLHAVLGNDCLFSDSEIKIALSTPPIANAGSDEKICGDLEVVLGNEPTLGVPPYTYEWSPANGLSATNILHPSVQHISTQTEYVLKVTDANGCIGYDAVIVTPYTVRKPEIAAIGNTNICHCDSVKITALENYETYLWNNGATTQSIYTSQPGTYSVTVTDINGCSNTSDPVTITTFEPNTVVSLNDSLIYTKPGEIIEIPLKIKSIDNFEECGLRNYIAKVSFDRSVLVPVNGTPIGIINEPIRTITINGSRNGLDPILTTLKLETVLGNTEYVKVKLDTFAWSECSGAIKMIDSDVKIVGLCYEGGTRLFNSSKVANGGLKTKTSQNSNSVNIQFGILERCQAQLYFSDMLGRVIKTFSYQDIESGSYELELNVSDFPPGVYICTLKVGDELYNQMMRITN